MSDNTFSSHPPGAVLAASAAGGAARVLPSSATDPNAIRPFRFSASQEALDDLRRRIKATKWPERETVADASQGVQLATIQALARYWLEHGQYLASRDDVARLGRDLFGQPGKDPVVSVAQFNTRVAPPDTQWHYASSETEILGLILRRVTGKPVADYLSEKIWQPIGAEADASWATDGTGQEVTFCCFNAVLRDYARFGRLLAHDGAWNGREVIPRQWLMDATTVRSSDAHLAPGVATKYYGYGYQVWLLPGADRRFVLLGIRGQMIFVDPATKLVMVHTAVRAKPVDRAASAETIALWIAVVDQLGRHAQ